VIIVSTASNICPFYELQLACLGVGLSLD